MAEKVHIVCLDAPSPPNYGGVFDLYYKIPALYKQGIKVILHYFEYRDSRGATGLEPYCEAIYSYQRSSFASSLPAGLPYIVHSRINKELIDRLNLDSYPVIIEGIHCSGIISFLQKDRRIMLRLHNDEALYYQHLSKWEQNFFKKIYLQRESRLLKRYQNKLPKNLTVVCVSETDQTQFRDRYGFRDTHFIPCFLPWQQVQSKEGKGGYCLYHGNLSVSENKEAVKWLIDLLRETDIPLIIAGRDAASMTFQYGDTNTRLIDNPRDDQLNELIANAHIHLLPSFNRTGVKIKMLHALFQGRFFLTNKDGVLGSGLTHLVPALEGKDAWLDAIQVHMNTEFSNELREERQQILSVYNNAQNARKLKDLIDEVLG